jgi:hypothetical protein
VSARLHALVQEAELADRENMRQRTIGAIALGIRNKFRIK